jgi:hypothetical protein
VGSEDGLALLGRGVAEHEQGQLTAFDRHTDRSRW